MDAPDADADVDAVAITRRTYDEGAHAYAEWSRRYTKFPGLQGQLRKFVEVTDSAHPVLDAGCGAGRDSWEMVIRGRRVISLDLSLCLLLENMRDLGTLGAARAKVQADLRAIPLACSSLGGVWACASLIHLPEESTSAVLTDLLRLMRGGAPIWASFKARGETGWQESSAGPLAGPRWFTRPEPGDLCSAFTRAGFTDVELVHDSHEWLHIAARSPN